MPADNAWFVHNAEASSGIGSGARSYRSSLACSSAALGYCPLIIHDPAAPPINQADRRDNSPLSRGSRLLGPGTFRRRGTGASELTDKLGYRDRATRRCLQP
ncbi:hypothetical protein J6590_015232 [Homalodisca vitripennis]|nr:hypothetical protein J6590_015232 [Homalodisca vitripennis]